EIIVAAAESHDGVGCSELAHVLARVDLVDHEGEIDRLRRQRLISRNRGGRPHGTVVLARIVAHHALLDLIAVFAVKGKARMALVALIDADYSASGLYWCSIHREREHIVVGAVVHGRSLSRTRQDREAAAAFHADRIGPCGVRRNRVSEGIGARAITAAPR